MLIMLNPSGDSWERTQWDFTLLTFPRWEAKKASGRGNCNNVNDVESLFWKSVPFNGKVNKGKRLNPNGDSWERARCDLT